MTSFTDTINLTDADIVSTDADIVSTDADIVSIVDDQQRQNQKKQEQDLHHHQQHRDHQRSSYDDSSFIFDPITINTTMLTTTTSTTTICQQNNATLLDERSHHSGDGKLLMSTVPMNGINNPTASLDIATISSLTKDNIIPKDQHQQQNGIDLNQLCHYMEQTSQISNQVNENDTLLFLGTTDNGKSIMMLYLTNTSFTENETCFIAIQSNKKVTSKNKKKFKKQQQQTIIIDDHKQHKNSMPVYTTIMMVDGNEIVLSDDANSTNNVSTITCDSSLRNNNNSICDNDNNNIVGNYEYEYVNHIGIIQSLYRAKSVKPVLVLNKRSVMKHGIDSIIRTHDMVLHMTGHTNKNDIQHEKHIVVDFTVFRFVFIDCTQNDHVNILNKLSTIRNEIIELRTNNNTNNSILFMLDVMIYETTNNFLCINEKEENLTNLRYSLLSDENVNIITNPTKFFVPNISNDATQSFKYSLHEINQKIIYHLISHQYNDAIPLFEFIQHIRHVMFSIESIIIHDVSIDTIHETLLEQWNVCLSRILSLPYHNKEQLIDEMKTLRSICNCICIMEGDVKNDDDTIADSVTPYEMKLSMLLHIISDFVNSWSPIEFGWKLLVIQEINNIIQQYTPILNNISKLCQQTLIYMDESICNKFKQMMVVVKSTQEDDPPYIQCMIYHRQQVLDIHSIVTIIKELRTQQDDNLYMFQNKLSSFLYDIQQWIITTSNDINQFTNMIEDRMKSKLLYNDLISIYYYSKLRNQLLNILGTEECYQILYQNGGWYIWKSIVEQFDEILVKWLYQSISELELSIENDDIMQECTNIEMTLEKQHVSTLLAKIEELQQFCTNIHTWEQFDHNHQIYELEIKIEKMLHYNESSVIHVAPVPLIQEVEENQYKPMTNAKHDVSHTLKKETFNDKIQSGNNFNIFSNTLNDMDDAQSWDSFTVYDRRNTTIDTMELRRSNDTNTKLSIQRNMNYINLNIPMNMNWIWKFDYISSIFQHIPTIDNVIRVCDHAFDRFDEYVCGKTFYETTTKKQDSKFTKTLPDTEEEKQETF